MIYFILILPVLVFILILPLIILVLINFILLSFGFIMDKDNKMSMTNFNHNDSEKSYDYSEKKGTL